VKYVAALLAAAVVLLAVELGMGAWSFGQVPREDPCTATTPSLGSGVDAALQRIVLDGLNGAACRLHTTREQLVEALGPSGTKPRQWSDRQIEEAVRAGLVHAIDEAEHRGDLPGIVATLLREAAKHAPLKFLIQGGTSLTDLLGQLLGGS
jgi:hypothetical protein